MPRGGKDVGRFTVEAADDLPIRRVEVLLRVGSGAAPDSAKFLSPQDAFFLPGGGFFVADWRRYDIRRFRPDGSIRVAFGRRGEGPGEFQSLRRILPLGNDSLMAYDDELGRFSVFDVDGNLGRTFRPSWVGDGLDATHVFRNADGLVVALREPGNPRALLGQSRRDSLRIVLADLGGVGYQATDIILGDRWWTYTLGNNSFQVTTPPDGPHALIAATRTALLMSDNTTRRIEAIPWDAVRLNAVTPPSTERTSDASTTAVFGKMLYDDRGGVWITNTVSRTRDRRWYRMSEEGVVTDLIEIPSGTGLLAVRGDTMLTRHADGGVVTLQVIRLR